MISKHIQHAAEFAIRDLAWNLKYDLVWKTDIKAEQSFQNEQYISKRVIIVRFNIEAE